MARGKVQGLPTDNRMSHSGAHSSERDNIGAKRLDSGLVAQVSKTIGTNWYRPRSCLYCLQLSTIRSCRGSDQGVSGTCNPGRRSICDRIASRTCDVYRIDPFKIISQLKANQSGLKLTEKFGEERLSSGLNRGQFTMSP